MATFFARWQFRHPDPQDFFAVASEVSGEDLTWFFDEAHRSSNVFDYGIQELTNRPLVARGFFDSERGPAFSAQTDTDGMFQTAVVVRRYGEAIFPVDVLVVFEDGEEVRERWNGQDRWVNFSYERPARAVSAFVDPDRVLLLDVNYTNNSKVMQPRTDEATTKWMLKWMVWLQDLMLTYAFLV